MYQKGTTNIKSNGKNIGGLPFKVRKKMKVSMFWRVWAMHKKKMYKFREMKDVIFIQSKRIIQKHLV